MSLSCHRQKITSLEDAPRVKEHLRNSPSHRVCLERRGTDHNRLRTSLLTFVFIRHSLSSRTTRIGVQPCCSQDMEALGLANGSPPPPRSPLTTNAPRLVLIDNYDSFTWNVYQYLVLEGADVSVYRNDKVTLDEVIAMQPTQLVISPGPGHPDRDSGVSQEAIRHFAGKIPVLGICMGE